jgi:hypothetical protein
MVCGSHWLLEAEPEERAGGEGKPTRSKYGRIRETVVAWDNVVVI